MFFFPNWQGKAIEDDYQNNCFLDLYVAVVSFLEMIIDPLFHFLPYGDKVEQSNQWPTQFLQFISIPINIGFLDGGCAHKIRGLFNHNPSILVFSEL